MLARFAVALILLVASVTGAEMLHPGGGSQPLDGLPLWTEFGGTGSDNTAFVDGDCIESFVDTDGLMKFRSAGDPCGTGAGGTPVPTQTPWSCGAGNGARGMGSTPDCFVVPTPDGAGGGGTFDAIGAGTNTTAAMVVGSGASLAPAGTGSITATTLPVSGSLSCSSSPGKIIGLTGGSGQLIYCDPDGLPSTKRTALGNSSGDALNAVDLTCSSACISSSEITDGTVAVGDLASADFGDWTCNGTTCVVDGNSVALGTDTTGNYAAGDAEAGNATGLACTTCVDDSDVSSITTRSKLPSALAYEDEANTFTATPQRFAAEVSFRTSVTTDGITWDPTSKTLAADDGTLQANDVACTGCVNTTDLLNGTVAVGDLASADFGSFTCNGTTCAVDTGAIGATELASTTVAAASYTNATITVDADGRLTAASSGTPTLTVQEGDSTVSTASTLDFTSTDFNVSDSPTGEANISLDANVVKVGGASILSTQLPTSIAADDVSRCVGTDNDWCVTYNSTAALAQAGNAPINIGPTPTASATPTLTPTPTSTAATPTPTGVTPTVQATPTVTGATATPTAVATPALLVRGVDARTCLAFCLTNTSTNTTYYAAASGIGSTIFGDAWRSLVPFGGYFKSLQCVSGGDAATGDRKWIVVETCSTLTSSTDGAVPTCTWVTATQTDIIGTKNVAEYNFYGTPSRSGLINPGAYWRWKIVDTNDAGAANCCVQYCPEP